MANTIDICFESINTMSSIVHEMPKSKPTSVDSTSSQLETSEEFTLFERSTSTAARTDEGEYLESEDDEVIIETEKIFTSLSTREYQEPTPFTLNLLQIIKRSAINLVLPFINGMMLGFGEILAHEIGFRYNWVGARVQPPRRMQKRQLESKFL